MSDSLSMVGNFISATLDEAEGGEASKNAPEGEKTPEKGIADIYGDFFENFDFGQLYGDSFEYGRGIGNDAEKSVDGWLESFIPSWSSLLIGALAVGLILLGAWAMLGGSTVVMEGD